LTSEIFFFLDEKLAPAIGANLWYQFLARDMSWTLYFYRPDVSKCGRHRWCQMYYSNRTCMLFKTALITQKASIGEN